MPCCAENSICRGTQQLNLRGINWFGFEVLPTTHFKFIFSILAVITLSKYVSVSSKETNPFCYMGARVPNV